MHAAVQIVSFLRDAQTALMIRERTAEPSQIEQAVRCDSPRETDAGHPLLSPASLIRRLSDQNETAWIGLVPKQHSNGDRNKFGSISKQARTSSSISQRPPGSFTQATAQALRISPSAGHRETGPLRT